jgi:hypothetical protein
MRCSAGPNNGIERLVNSLVNGTAFRKMAYRHNKPPHNRNKKATTN